MRTPVGGLFRHVRDLARAQAEAGHEVGVVCDSVSGDRLTDERLATLSRHLALGLHRFPMVRDIGWQDRLCYIAIRELAGSLDLDVMHGHGAKGGAFARLAAEALRREGRGPATFYTPHGGSLNFAPGSAKGLVYMALERRLLEATDGLVFESAHAERVFAAQVAATGPARRVIYNGLLPEDFRTATPISSAADFVFIGELSPVKGVDVLLQAMRMVNDHAPARLFVVGDGRLRGELEAQARALGLGAAITFTGALPIRQALSLGRCMVMPSRAESLPYVALETAAAGVPMVATRVGGIPEIVSGSGTPLVPPRDAAVLAAAMRAVRADPAAAVNRALFMRATIRQRFSVETMTRDVLAFYGAALARRAAA
jgi:glycosyltransferase involved in cell wall biosynthesis